MKEKKRDHKMAVNKYRQRRFNDDVNIQRKIEEKLFEEYAGGQKIMPMPSLNEALASQDMEKDSQLKDAMFKMINYFSDDLEQILKHQKNIKCCLPDNAVSFIIPLDFYIPLASPYNAVAIRLTNDEITYATCVSIISKTTPVGESAVKTSYLISTICSNGASIASKNEASKEFLKIYEEAISACNNIIASFQAIPSRHNHYFHSITCQSAPSRINYFSFSRRAKKILKKMTLYIHGNVHGEIFQCHKLDEQELNFFRNLHLNKSFSDDKIFQLVNKINEAVNTRCFGNNNEAIVLADNFVELSLGYLYCEIRIAKEEDCTKVYEDYSKIKSMNEIWDALVNLLSYSSKTKLKNDIGFNDWMRDCRNKRDDLTHRFLTSDFTSKESLEAIYFSGELIRKLCIIIDNKIKCPDYPISDKMHLLASSTSFIKWMREHDEAERNGKKYPHINLAQENGDLKP